MKIELVDYAKLKVNYSLRTRIYVSTLNKKCVLNIQTLKKIMEEVKRDEV